LTRLAGNVEVELKLFWDQETIIKEIQSDNREFSGIKDKINNTSSFAGKTKPAD